jgi:hypothetical protein
MQEPIYMHWWDLVSVITGVVGVALAIWTHLRELQARAELTKKENELNIALASLKRAREFMNS